MFCIQLYQLRHEIICQSFSSFVSWKTIFFLIIDDSDQKIFKYCNFAIIKLSQCIKSFMWEKNWLFKMRVRFNKLLNCAISANIFKLKDSLVSESYFLLWIDELLKVFLLLVVFHIQQLYKIIVLYEFWTIRTDSSRYWDSGSRNRIT